jgi:hypothetical protein
MTLMSFSYAKKRFHQIHFAPSALSLQAAIFPGALPQAVTFRALGADTFAPLALIHSRLGAD